MAEAVAKRHQERLNIVPDPALNAGYDAPPPLAKAPSPPHALIGMEALDTSMPPPAVAGHVPLEKVSEGAEAAACGHARAGQDMCNLCHGRSRRNIPVSFEEEKKRKDREEDRILQQYQREQDQKAIEVEQKRNAEVWEERRKMAAFNKNKAEQQKKQQAIKETNVHPSYIFDLRPLTPPRYVAQDKYHRDLYSQVDSRVQKKYKDKEDREEQERQDQKQLAEDLAKQRGAFLNAKRTTQYHYKNALQAQVDNKPEEVPKAVPDASQPIFGITDNSVEKVNNRKTMNEDVAQHQAETDMHNKKSALLAKMDKQREEAEALAKIKDEMVNDRSNRFTRNVDNRKGLEEDWFSAHSLKLQREAEDRARFRAPCNLVQEQTDGYNRCDQCERQPQNGGESNIWRDSRYAPGSRIMV